MDVTQMVVLAGVALAGWSGRRALAQRQMRKPIAVRARSERWPQVLASEAARGGSGSAEVRPGGPGYYPDARTAYSQRRLQDLRPEPDWPGKEQSEMPAWISATGKAFLAFAGIMIAVAMFPSYLYFVLTVQMGQTEEFAGAVAGGASLIGFIICLAVIVMLQSDRGPFRRRR